MPLGLCTIDGQRFHLTDFPVRFLRDGHSSGRTSHQVRLNRRPAADLQQANAVDHAGCADMPTIRRCER